MKMKEETFEDHYPHLYVLLAGYFSAVADMGMFDIESIIEGYMDAPSLERRWKALKEAKEVLALDPFPEDLIGDLMNTCSETETRKQALGEITRILARKLHERELRSQQK